MSLSRRSLSETRTIARRIKRSLTGLVSVHTHTRAHAHARTRAHTSANTRVLTLARTHARFISGKTDKLSTQFNLRSFLLTRLPKPVSRFCSRYRDLLENHQFGTKRFSHSPPRFEESHSSRDHISGCSKRRNGPTAVRSAPVVCVCVYNRREMAFKYLPPNTTHGL